MLSLAARINANVLCFLQLTGIAVLAIGLWLRFDSQTKSIFEQENSHSSFYTGEHGRLGAFSNCGDALLTQGRGLGEDICSGHIGQSCPFQVSLLCGCAHEFALD